MTHIHQVGDSQGDVVPSAATVQLQHIKEPEIKDRNW